MTKIANILNYYPKQKSFTNLLMNMKVGENIVLFHRSGPQAYVTRLGNLVVTKALPKNTFKCKTAKVIVDDELHKGILISRVAIGRAPRKPTLAEQGIKVKKPHRYIEQSIPAKLLNLKVGQSIVLFKGSFKHLETLVHSYMDRGYIPNSYAVKKAWVVYGDKLAIGVYITRQAEGEFVIKWRA